jgi:hypothetical protein
MSVTLVTNDCSEQAFVSRVHKFLETPAGSHCIVINAFDSREHSCCTRGGPFARSGCTASGLRYRRHGKESKEEDCNT